MNRIAAEKGNGAVRGSTTWALNMCVDLRKRDAVFAEMFGFDDFGRNSRNKQLVQDSAPEAKAMPLRQP
ncbi:hypothetical protein [Paenarthrobacter sp. NPDC091669]|uniref:hypothetical protein n=1 Tax=Paenarthrobacter sp. NPDC091669 TaxID=3364384 RepID=UPI0037F62982